MKQKEIIAELKELQRLSKHDPEVAHDEADKLILKYVNDGEITEAFNLIKRWYT
ncbi:hypothetical protein LCGC14_0965010 [marine sediment metagenome]|uniref:Uncharacterized protein n=1 Tax=marine sediment metagenome TaxID=412755 RepID=A0A0F9QWL2_9ZZZZ